MADHPMLSLQTVVKCSSVATGGHRRRPWHGGARPCSGSAGLASLVASSLEQLHVLEKTKQMLGKKERCGDALATMNCNTGEVWPWLRHRKTGQGPSPKARLAQRECRRGSWGASGALGGILLAVVQRRACASAAEPMATSWSAAATLLLLLQ